MASQSRRSAEMGEGTHGEGGLEKRARWPGPSPGLLGGCEVCLNL